MKINKIEDMTNGWFVGNFEPSIIKTKNVEVALKSYNKGDKEARHYHKIATEITVISQGRCCMNNMEFKKGDIITIQPNESTDFEALENGTQTIVVKYPSAINDKFFS